MMNEDLVNASGKMLMLNKLLTELFARGHKVLLFSQFTSMLDIIQDWAEEYKQWPVCRIDGSTKQDDRRAQMKAFNDDKSTDAPNLFLLSTRAGGVGINLVSADTVILFDSDWNPQMDLQAQDRAHRIGQTRPVLVFRLISANSIENQILAKAGAKRKLEALVIGEGAFRMPGAEVSDILTGGKRKTDKGNLARLAEALLTQEGEEVQLASKDDEIISKEQLDRLLDRSVRSPWVARTKLTRAVGRSYVADDGLERQGGCRCGGLFQRDSRSRRGRDAGPAVDRLNAHCALQVLYVLARRFLRCIDRHAIVLRLVIVVLHEPFVVRLDFFIIQQVCVRLVVAAS
jgi:superfamily II DNA/RNA helicase